MTPDDEHRDSLGERKQRIRRQGYTIRRDASDRALDEIANRSLFEHIMGRDPHVVSAYMAIRTEIDPRTTMTRLVEADVTVCVPVIVGPGVPLEFHEWTPTSEMIQGEFGASIPLGGTAMEPDVVITPLIAFDDTGNRLGYGGGFYDRTLRHLRTTSSVHAVGLAYAAQQIDVVPTEPTDVRLDAVVTELGVRLFSS